ncbi:MAG: N-acetyl-1-D-myo-inositol-2-amino-2-deoxy-alpha-D-glucopyranoside deacetylase [Acidothermus sp.]|nr:N-acetyl-1-D-myo-inositol-2-amino-2-deoxy-alpha-D-glucopyranoside deacetylase [Acidothermus sp.]MCL6537915.1 N-acetyl-1-D-myo-inositol-2-amino-2-deoxy-alpha-D-glucopyranoside deacetylase [Acidothermus sp.]
MTRSLLLVHAHPDDESIGTGATMAYYAAQGVHVTLVTCTLGEEGEILVPELRLLGADEADQLGGYRIWELRRACAALGVTDQRFLGGAGRYRDSGMMGTPANSHPRSFWQADLDEAADHLVEVIREIRPQVVVTYDENGGYGHPDHIQAHRVTVRAVERTRDIVAKLYATAVPRSAVEEGIRALREAGHPNFFGVDNADEVPFARPDDVITATIDARAHLDQKIAALRAHATQIAVDGPFFALSNNIGQKAFGIEHYVLLEGKPEPDTDGREHDLFAGT